jgi:ATP-binding cassette subfamily B protein
VTEPLLSWIHAPRPPLLERFPALRRLGRSTRRRIPLVQQLAATECGVACLGMVLGYFGKTVPLDALRDACGPGRDGVSALDLLNAASFFGLRARPARLEIDDLAFLTPASILHWEFDHFVVFEGLTADAVDILDPALGRRRVPVSAFRRSFTGVALLFERGEDFQPEVDRSHRVLRYLRRVLAESGSLGRVLVTSLLIQLFALGLPLFTGALVERVAPRSDAHLLAVLGVGLAALVGFQFLASMVRTHLLLNLRTELDARMTLDFLEHLIDLPYAFFQRRSAGDLLMRLNSNATIRELLTTSVLSAAFDGGMVALYLVILLVADPRFCALVLALGLVQVAVFLTLQRRQRELLGQSLQLQARSESYEVEMFAGIETLKAMGAEQRAVEHWSGLFVDVLNVSLTRGSLDAWGDSLLSTLRLASPLALLVYGAWAVIAGHLSLGAMLALAAVGQGFLGPLANLVIAATQFQLLGSYVERIDDVLAAAPEQDRSRTRPAPRLRGRVTVENVSFRYAPASPLALDDVSVEIAPGAFVAVVGRSGSGKSTLASVLLGLHRPTEGRVLYDGTDATELEVRSLRRQVGIVMQRAYIFGGSIRHNIAFADPGLTQEDVERAARLAFVHDEILAMPMGYEAVLQDGGHSISGGQRQRLALARALVRKPAILLLDEATSALDALTESDVLRSLRGQGCTRIVVAHRLSTIVDADLILHVDQGRVVEQGRHEELMARKGPYAALVNAQLR